MSTPLISQLREEANVHHSRNPEVFRLLHLAADRIDALESENAALRERLRDVLWLVEARPGEVLAPRILDICRAALATDKEQVT